MIKILGIDPGSRVTGYGIIEVQGDLPRYLISGCIRLPTGTLAERLGKIFHSLEALILEWQPQEVAIEEVFVHHNVQGALKLGQARGAAMAAISHHALSICGYSAREIKKSVAGYGGADKHQIQCMVKTLLRLTSDLATDAADALAIALCHAQQRRWQATLAAATQNSQKII